MECSELVPKQNKYQNKELMNITSTKKIRRMTTGTTLACLHLFFLQTVGLIDFYLPS